MPVYQSNRPAQHADPGDAVYLFGIPNTAAVIAASPGGAVRAGGVVTITTSAAHNFLPGNQVDIRNVMSVGGFTQPMYGFDGQYKIASVPSTTTFTYADPQKPNDTGGGGVAVSVAAEAVVLGEASAQVELRNNRGTTTVQSSEIEGQFTGAPGAFEVDMQSADTDTDDMYIMNTVSTATKIAALAADANAINSFRADLSPSPGRFLRARIIAFANFATINLILKTTNSA